MNKNVKKEFIKKLLSENKIKFNKNYESSLKNTPFENYDFFKMMEYIKNDGFGLFLYETYYKLRNFDYPDELRFLLSKIWENFTLSHTYIVGGAVRDIILNKKPKDYDIVTDIPYKILKELFKDFKIKEVGKHFGVLMVKVGDMSFEIANFRKDIYNEYGKGATSVEIGTLKDDIKRRDFDVNDLYYNLYFEELIDGNETGLNSLYKKEFNFVGDGNERVKEDVLRLLRIGKLIKKGLKPSKNVKKIFRNNLHLLCEYGNIERIREHLEEIMEF